MWLCLVPLRKTLSWNVSQQVSKRWCGIILFHFWFFCFSLYSSIRQHHLNNSNPNPSPNSEFNADFELHNKTITAWHFPRFFSHYFLIFAGLYLNVAKKVVSHDTTNAKNSKHNSNSRSDRLGKIYIDPSAAPYQTVRGNVPVHIHPSSVLFSNPSGRKLPEYIVYSELLITTKHYMRNVTAVEGSWLMEVAPDLFKRAV